MIYIPIFNLIKTKGAVINCYFLEKWNTTQYLI